MPAPHAPRSERFSPHPANPWLAAGFTLLHLFALFVLPLWLLPLSPVWGVLLLVPVLLTTSWWALQHEAMHGLLTTDKTWNRRLGRLQAVLFGAPFDLLRWGHLLHHGFSRTVRERSEVYALGRERRAVFALAYYFRLLGGLYVMEVIGAWLFLLPRAWVRQLATWIGSERNLALPLAERVLKPDTLAATRLDTLAILSLYGLAFLAYGAMAWMLALAIFGRALLISLVDNSFHYATALDNPRHARNLALPAWAARMILHFNLHGVHHAQPSLPWQALPAQHRISGGRYDGAFFAALWAQFRGPIAETALPSARVAATP